MQATSVNEPKVILTEFQLYQNYPNPFNPSTKIRYEIYNIAADLSAGNASFSQRVTLRVYNILGREIQTLVNEKQKPGNYQIVFNGENLNSGIYFYELKNGNYRESRKMLLIK